MAFSSHSSSKTLQLPQIIGEPISFEVIPDENGDKNLLIASNNGLHHVRLEGQDDVKYVRALRFGICMGVVLLDRSKPGSETDGDTEKKEDHPYFLCAVFSGETAARLGPHATAEIIFFRKDILTGGDMRKIDYRLTCDRAWGRIRKMAFSDSLNTLFLSTKVDHDFRSVYQSSSVWTLPLTDPTNDSKPCPLAQRLIHKKPGNIRHMAINNSGNLLAHADLTDDVHHTVDLHDAKTGDRLFQVSHGTSARGPYPATGIVRFPRGLAFGGQNGLYVADETKRVQKFYIDKKRCDGIVLKPWFSMPMALAVVGQELYVLGCHKKQGRSVVIPSNKAKSAGAYMTICGLK